MQEKKGEHVCEERSITDLSDQNQKKKQIGNLKHTTKIEKIVSVCHSNEPPISLQYPKLLD